MQYDYSNVTRLIREALVEYRRVDPEGDRNTFADFVDDVTGNELVAFVERRAASWPRGEGRGRLEHAISLHRALGAAIASLGAMMPEPVVADSAKPLRPSSQDTTERSGDGNR